MTTRDAHAHSWQECLEWLTIARDDNNSHSQETGPTGTSARGSNHNYAAAAQQMERSFATNPAHLYNVSSWWSYLDAVEERLLEEEEQRQQQQQPAASSSSPARVSMDWIFRRALSHLPRSYKLWKRYWEFLLQWEKRHHQSSSSNSEPLGAAEEGNDWLLPRALTRALWTCHKFPRVWEVYFEFLRHHPTYQSITLTRRRVAACLEALPITQHSKVWPSILEALEAIPNLPVETQSRLLARHAQLDPTRGNRVHAEYLLRHGRWQAAALAHWKLLHDHAFDRDSVSAGMGDLETVWRDLIQLCAQHPHDVASVPWERTLSGFLLSSSARGNGPSKGGNSNTIPPASSVPTASVGERGQLWSWWAESYVRRGNFDMARSLYERGLQNVSTVQDFTVLYHAYLQMEEELLDALAQQVPDDDNDDDNNNNETVSASEWDILLVDEDESAAAAQHAAATNLEWAFARAEHLTQRRPLWLNRVLLRQNPHDVGEWLKRAKLLGDGRQATEALEEALRVVHANQAINGNPTQLVYQLLTLYETTATIDQARDLMDRICNGAAYRFRSADDLAECWTFWVELELRHEAWDSALALARQAVAPNPNASGAGARQWNLTKSLRLWDLRLDLEESLGTVQTTKDAYNRALAMKAATVQHVLNFCAFLTEHKYYEESFTVYERGLELFPFPHKGAKVLWKEYLQAFLGRYQGTKIERVRDMFQRCLESCPPDECAEFFLMDAEFEEQHGLAKRALGVYRAMCDKVPKEEKLTAYQLFVAKTAQYLGLTATRDIYQDAMNKLDDKSAATMCLDFAKMETGLQQIDRARAILAYGAQMADPRQMPEFWKTWNDFEIAHGNEETFRDMLRIKRSVEAAFSTVNYNATGMSDKVETLSDAEAMRMIANQEGVEIDDHLPKTSVAGFVAGKRSAAAASLEDVEERVAKLRKAASAPVEPDDDDANDEEIDIDDIDAEIEEAAAEGAAAVEAAAATELESTPKATGKTLRDVAIKSVPAAVFGGLAPSTND